MIRARLIYPMHGLDDVQAGADALTALDRHYLATHGRTPRLYASGVRYRREAAGGPEEWQSAPYALASGYADCEDLAAWRAAELPGARAFVVRSPSGYHVIVRRADGSLEDPSARLGMGR